MNKKISEWWNRYSRAEILSFFAVLLFSLPVYYTTHNRVLSAYTGAIGENLVYYLVMATKDFNENSKKLGTASKIRVFFKTFRNLALEFAPSEALDNLIVRPFCLYIFPILTGSFIIGIIIGKFAADIVFYVPTIISYELRKKYLN